ncbi:scopoletin glucosyltransferase [Trifolium repens]|nr:scopoletin glucosyltransferase [Trifolium repens]
MSATKQSGFSCSKTCSSGSLKSKVDFMNLMNLSGANADSEFSQPSGKPVSSGEGNLIVLMSILAFPMVLEMRGTFRFVVTMVTLRPLEEKTLARSTQGMM